VFRQTPSPQWADLLIQGLKLIVCLPSATFAMWQGLAQKTAPTPLFSVFWCVSVKGYPKSFIKAKNAPLQNFLDVLPLTCVWVGYLATLYP